MAEPVTGKSEPEKTPADRLDSWKEIAAYLSRDVTTVQRWEKREGMPVHRHRHDKLGSVYASRTELDAWVSKRKPATPEANTEPESSTPPSHSRTTAFVVVAAIVAIAIVALWITATRRPWRNPIADARFQIVTDFGGVEQAAAISRDGQLVAFLSDRDGQTDVWLTQVSSGQFHNLTRGSAPELINPSIRTLRFSPDGSLITFWVRKPNNSGGQDISIWAVPTLGGQPKPYLEGAAEFDWSRDGSKLAYHTPDPGDPLFVSSGSQRSDARPLFTAAAGLHSHFPSWSPDGDYIYFVQGTLPDKLDIWRLTSRGGAAERITSHNTHVSHPVFLNKHTLMYLASDADGSGPWLYSMDLNDRVPHRLNSGPDRYTSLDASSDGQRLVLTLASPKRTLWRLSLAPNLHSIQSSSAAPISLTTRSGFSPRLGSNFLVYLSATGKGESIWKYADGVSTELWNGEGVRILGGPAIASDGRIAFSARENGKARAYVMQADGTNLRLVCDSLDLQGSPAWFPDGQSLLVAANDRGVPHLYRVPLEKGSPVSLVEDYSLEPNWAPDGKFVLYSGPDVGTTFDVKAISPDGRPYSIRNLRLTRGTRHMTVLADGKSVIALRGEIQHKNLWVIDLETGAERQLTNFNSEFDINDFDVSPDGRELVLERVQEHSDVVLLDLAHTEHP